jgi:hypothetical protein
MKEIRKGQRFKRQREHHEGTGDKDIRRKRETSYVFWGKKCKDRQFLGLMCKYGTNQIGL